MQRPQHLIPAMLLASLLALAAGCGRGGRDYSRWTHLPAEGWAYGDTLMLVPADTALADNDSLVSRPLRLGVVHTSAYPYSNLWLEITYRGDHKVYRDTVNLTLADVYGRWIGKGFGSYYQREVLLTPEADIDVRRPVAVRHIMRLDTLRHIDRIGVSVEE